jgi:Copper transport outer membrane protein, MctB
VFDFRYHAISLAAVLLALVLGVLIGIAIGDSSLLSSAHTGLVHNLDSELSEARQRSETVQHKLVEEEAFGAGLYPLAVHELLRGRNVGLVFLGASSDEVNALVRGTVSRAGGSVATVVAVREPLELEGIARAAAGTRYAGLASSSQLLERFAEIAGRELVIGGPGVERGLLGRARASLLSAFDGQLTHLEGVVVARAEPSGTSAVQRQAAESFESGLLAGLAAAAVPTVGVELKSSPVSQIGWYKSKGISSVDDLDALAGQAALAYALAGAHGAFGVKPTADSLLPAPPPGG